MIEKQNLSKPEIIVTIMFDVLHLTETDSCHMVYVTHYILVIHVYFSKKASQSTLANVKEIKEI